MDFYEWLKDMERWDGEHYACMDIAQAAWDYQQARIEALEAAATDVVECGVDAMAYDRRQVLDALAPLLQEPTND